MQELLSCHEMINSTGGEANTAATAAGTADGAAKRPANESNVICLNGLDEGGESSNKRLKVDRNQHKQNGHQPNVTDMIDLTMDSDNNMDHSIFGDVKVVTLIAGFLDPPTIVRCFLVSKSWRKNFAKQESWQEMATGRFGQYNVRQWKGKLEDDDEGIAAPSPLTLYRSMDAANVMPHVSHEGMFLLGEARLPGRCSAWTFLVERSNGETLRSVKRNETAEGGSSGMGIFVSLPVVELRTVVQNTGSVDEPVIVREQLQTVDASTRRRGVELAEIDWDGRFKKRVLNLDGSERQPLDPSLSSATNPGTNSLDVHSILCRLKLFDAVVIQTYIHAKGCSTTSKFVQRSNFTKVLVQIRNGTIPMVIPFPRDISHHLEH